MMICALCDQDIIDERPLFVFGEPVHGRCDVIDDKEWLSDSLCDDQACMWWRCIHGGACVT